jgi:hypothetical protein
VQAGARIASLDVSDNRLAADALRISSQLSQLSAVKALAFNNCGFASWPLAGLSGGCLQALQTLELCGNSFGGSLTAHALAACPCLTTLDLTGRARKERRSAGLQHEVCKALT